MCHAAHVADHVLTLPPSWRASRPTRVALRYAAVAAVAVALAATHLPRPRTFCLLRATTGLPCPFCGGTTSAADLGRGRIGAAFAASPLAPLLLAAWPLLGNWPLFGNWPAPGWSRSRGLRWAAVAVVLAAAEVWQLRRFGWISG
jgi:Protein of unknown function (DUF2752)